MKKQNGYSMIELMVVLVVIVGAFGLVIKYYPSMRDSWDANGLVQNVTNFHGLAVESCTNGDCTNVTSARLVSGNILKEFHNSANTDILSVSGSPVVFGPANIGTGSSNGLSQVHSDVDQRVCNLTAKRIWDTVAALNVNGVAVKASTTDPMDEDSINTNCTVALNSMDFIIRA